MESKDVFCCGTFTIDNNKVLMIKHKNGGHWAFPKGHMEDKESKQQTAIRETREETGIDVEIISDIYFEDNYFIERYNENKFVTYFIAKPKNTNYRKQQTEIQEVEWVNIADALEKITYPQTKKCFEKFLIYWKENNDN